MYFFYKDAVILELSWILKSGMFTMERNYLLEKKTLIGQFFAAEES